MHRPILNIIILSRFDIQKLVDYPKNLRDQIVIDLSRLQAFRGGEIPTLRWEYVDVDGGWISVLDSKKHVLIRLPLNWQLADLLREYREDAPSSEYVIRPLPSVNVKKSGVGKPMTTDSIQNIVKWYAEKADIPNWQDYTPTLLRAFFAAEWFRQKRSLKILQAIMRHNYLSTTLQYVGRIVFSSELKEEFDRVQGRTPEKSGYEILQGPVARQCMECPANLVCKYRSEAVGSEWAGSCRFFAEIMERTQNLLERVQG